MSLCINGVESRFKGPQFRLQETHVSGGNEAGPVPLPGHRVLYLGADGIEVQGYPRATRRTSGHPIVTRHAAKCSESR